ncbi:unnamed protein product [Didymodactylos carnosus]|uniref:Uncharacterized protein n=1 Tax=Didymodactylos carnosus TaxID=1234261 RepID=A0A814J1T5_9BILA|nr:unnamed protein product [Didymodactylos carnosus]CAF3802949.1 unnamed protein product [Didymodactylos carnosus]
MALHNTESSVENKTVNHLSWSRFRRQPSSDGIETASAILSVLPLDKVGAIVGQVMSTGLKNMFSPDAGGRILDMLQEQGPGLLTGLFSNLYGLSKTPSKQANYQQVIDVPSSSNPTAALPKLRNSSVPLNDASKSQMNSLLFSSLFKK